MGCDSRRDLGLHSNSDGLEGNGGAAGVGRICTGLADEVVDVAMMERDSI